MAKKKNVKNRRRKKKVNYGKFTLTMQRKLYVAFAFVAFCLIGLSITIFVINYKKGDDYSKSVLSNQTYQTRTVPYVRGQILDRNGMVMAYSPKIHNLIIDASVMTASDRKYLESTLEALDKHFELDIEQIRTFVTENPNNQYYRAILGLTPSEIAAFVDLQNQEDSKIAGVWFEDEYTRVYPFDTLASDVIGFTVQGGTGELGLEKYYNDLLSGTDGVITTYVNDELNSVTNRIDAVDGNTIVTTIDYYIQSVVEKYIRQYNEEYGSKGTAVVVQNPKTGEILAMADGLGFDLNNPRDLTPFYTAEELEIMSDEEKLQAMYDVWKNFCVTDTYEPGSVIKPITIGFGLDEGVLTGNETFICDGYETIGGYNIHCDRVWGHGELTLMQSVMYSCNDCLMQISAIEGVTLMSKYQNVFGYGQKTGIDLPGEEYGLLYDADKMTEVDLYTNSFGQNMNVTMVQMVSSFSALINGGNYYKPYLLKKVLNSNGELITETQPELLRKTVSEETSAIMREYLYETVENGTGRLAKVEGYAVGGKTGTAEKHPRNEEKYILSFIGFAPIDDPQVVVYVAVDEPNEEEPSHSACAKNISSQIMSEILPYLNVESVN